MLYCENQVSEEEQMLILILYEALLLIAIFGTACDHAPSLLTRPFIDFFYGLSPGIVKLRERCQSNDCSVFPR